MTATFYSNCDIHDKIKELPSGSIDLIYTSPPYGTTKAKWDTGLRWDELFPEMFRVLKKDGVIALHSSMPFSYHLLRHERPKYNYVWLKNTITGFLSAKSQPLRNCEEVYIYYKKFGTYNAQMIGDEVTKRRKHTNKSKEYYYNVNDENDAVVTEGHIGRYPTTFLEYPIRRDGGGITRPDEMIEFFIKTYSNAGETVLDMTCCNNLCGTVVTGLGRNYIGVDIREIKMI